MQKATKKAAKRRPKQGFEAWEGKVRKELSKAKPVNITRSPARVQGSGGLRVPPTPVPPAPPEPMCGPMERTVTYDYDGKDDEISHLRHLMELKDRTITALKLEVAELTEKTDRLESEKCRLVTDLARERAAPLQPNQDLLTTRIRTGDPSKSKEPYLLRHIEHLRASASPIYRDTPV
eukprot:TRINITY_DN3343_c3_g1_i1.p1 TRINITY_DN3343_c3_g1~~TRINITY_DN3343_c3_g1_i1.p1  ORF type:complete len:178 (+),score=19.64 TRINITY_DN3343_c3_g1_i1:71-604(+)